MRGEFRPRERLTERELAAQFHVSRTPIREALHKLQSLGMVRVIPNRGATVTDFSPEDIESLYLVRLKNEQLAARLTCTRITPDQIEQMEGINQELVEAVKANDYPLMILKDQEFHSALIRFCGNPFLVKVVEDLRHQSYPFSYYYWKGEKYTEPSISQHEKILGALRSRNVEILDALMESQLNNAKDRYLKYLA
jgi:DNA-binding GntR family transcriptional regulator